MTRRLRTLATLAACAALALGATPARDAARAPAGAEATAFDSLGFRLALPPYAFVFPRDHASHPEYRTEWWYFTGHVASGARRFGYELTFFRVGLPRAQASRASAWAARDLVFVHAALTDESRGRFRYADAARRAVLGMAGADPAREHVWLEADSLALDADGVTHHLAGHGPNFSLAFSLTAAKPPAIHGADGVSAKGPGRGNASHYYSLTRLATRGRLVVDGDTLAVEGRSWMDHEFASNSLGATLAGWDWFSVQLDDGRELMLYQLRLAKGGIEPLSHGTLVRADGTTRALSLADFRVETTGAWTSPRTGARYPSGWVLRVPAERLAIALEPVVKDQELVAASMGGVTYWEGSVRVRPVAGAPPVAGEGYVELTGYTGRAPY